MCDSRHSKQTKQGKATFLSQHEQVGGSSNVTYSDRFSGAAFRDLFSIIFCMGSIVSGFFVFSSSLNLVLHCSDVSRAAGIRLFTSYECTRFWERSRVCDGKCTKSCEIPRRTPSGLSKHFWHRSMLWLKSSFIHTMHWYRQNAMKLLHRSHTSRPLSQSTSVSSQAAITEGKTEAHTLYVCRRAIKCAVFSHIYTTSGCTIAARSKMASQSFCVNQSNI